MKDASRKTVQEYSESSQSADLLEHLLAHASVGFAFFSSEGLLRDANPAFRKLFGLWDTTRKSIKLAEFAPCDATSAAAVQFERLRAGKISEFSADCQCKGKDGARFWVTLSASVVDGVAGAPGQVMLECVDISDRKEAEDALVYEEARWQNALEAAGQGVWDHDARKDEMFYTRQWRRMRGLADDAVIDGAQEVWLARLHPDDRDHIRAVVNKQASGIDGHDSMVYRERHADGHYMWIWSRGKPIEWDENGDALRTVGTDTDISDLKAVEAQLATEKERLRVTLQSIGDGVITTDAERNVLFMNEVAEQMTGWTLEEALGSPVDSVFIGAVDDESQAVSTSVADCLKSGKVRRLNTYSKLTRKDGKIRFVRETAAPVRDEAGNVLGAVMVVRDGTQHRKMQRELSYRASHDGLTGLPNRSAFEQQLRKAIDDAVDNQSKHALCLIDLDHFKAVNDGAGHAAGDQLLKEVAGVLRKCCRKSDFAARIGGDEFVVVLNNCNMRVARSIAKKMVKELAGLSFKWQDQTFKIGASIGLASITNESDGAHALYKMADAACYAAKRKGRNCVIVAG